MKTIEEQLEYWKQRCLAAELFIYESPGDPDIHHDQIEAHNKWLDLRDKEDEYESI